jgi:hypothetical protein
MRQEHDCVYAADFIQIHPTQATLDSKIISLKQVVDRGTSRECQPKVQMCQRIDVVRKRKGDHVQWQVVNIQFYQTARQFDVHLVREGFNVNRETFERERGEFGQVFKNVVWLAEFFREQTAQAFVAYIDFFQCFQLPYRAWNFENASVYERYVLQVPQVVEIQAI